MPHVHRLLLRMVLQRATADDLTQEVFLRVAGKLDGFATHAQFSTWVHRIALNVAYSHLESAGRRRLAPLDRSAPPTAPVWHGPSERLQSSERLALIEQALAELAPKRRAALVLVCLEGKSIEDVALIEDCPPQTIYSRLHEARRQLKKQLKDLLP